ncbi:unnamed protein product, partial [Rotaria sp. Silwood2]
LVLKLIFSDAIEMGANLLEKYSYPGYSKHMFVLTDGLANIGLRTQEEIMNAIKKCDQFFFLESAEIIVTLMTRAFQSVFDICGTQAQLIARGCNNAIITKIWDYESNAPDANFGELHVNNLRVVLCDFRVSGAVSEGTEVDILDYQLKYNRPGEVDGESLIVTGKLSVTFINDKSFIQQIDPKVKTLHAVQVAVEINDKIAQLIEMLVRMTENM